MIKFLRTFLKIGGSTTNRTVIGTSISFDLKEVAHIKASNNRLSALNLLYKKYKGTAHEEKFRSVWEKTKKIHAYLISQKRLHELEIFHLQHTDHFLNTFQLIIDVHLRHKDETPVLISSAEGISSNADTSGKKIKGASESAQQLRTYDSEQTAFVKLTLPEVIINTNAKVSYQRENKLGKSVAGEISFTSSTIEKESFQSYLSGKLGIRSIFYVGNASIIFPESKSAHSPTMAPIIYWGNHAYALSLSDFRLFPVKIRSQGH